MRWTHPLLPAMLLAGIAGFRARLPASTPARRSAATSPVSPSAVTITYTEGVEPDFSTIEVQNAQGQRVDKADPHLLDGEQTKLSVEPAEAAAGDVHGDLARHLGGHAQDGGSFNFSVSP